MVQAQASPASKTLVASAICMSLLAGSHWPVPALNASANEKGISKMPFKKPP